MPRLRLVVLSDAWGEVWGVSDGVWGVSDGALHAGGRAQEVPQRRAASLTAWAYVTPRPEVTVISDCTTDIRSASRPPCPPF